MPTLPAGRPAQDASGAQLPPPGPARRQVEPHQVVAVLRVLVVLSMAGLVALGTPPHRTYLLAGSAFLATAAVYAVTIYLLARRDKDLRQSWVTVLDTVLTLAIIACSGGAESQAVAVLPLAVVAAAIRQGRAPAMTAAGAAGAVYAAVVLLVPRPDVPLPDRVESGAWWLAYLLAFAVLSGTLKSQLDLEHAAAVEAQAEARADQLAYLEERDLRERLLEAQQAQQDGVRVILHEFRTPVSSLAALTRVLGEQRPNDPQRDRVVELVSAHARHLEQMLDQLADVAVSTGSAVGRPRLREVALEGLVSASVSAAGLDRGAIDARVSPAGGVVRCDEQQVRRILTNLLHNAAQHAPGEEVSVRVEVAAGRLTMEVLDRGPGLPDGQELLVTQKYVRLAERDGTSGLGLWIVQQLVAGTGGQLVLAPRPGGGLAARVNLPLPDGQ